MAKTIKNANMEKIRFIICRFGDLTNQGTYFYSPFYGRIAKYVGHDKAYVIGDKGMEYVKIPSNWLVAVAVITDSAKNYFIRNWKLKQAWSRK